MNEGVACGVVGMLRRGAIVGDLGLGLRRGCLTSRDWKKSPWLHVHHGVGDERRVL